MNISPADLGAQFDRASVQWPFIRQVEVAFALPQFLLFAVGSRETNLTDEEGDGGHGWGVWQRDNRSWNVGPAYLADVHQQAVDAATLLVSNFHSCGGWPGACSKYNSGTCSDANTTGHDYGADVMGRMQWLQGNRKDPLVPPPAPPAPRLLRYVAPPGQPMTGNDVRFWQGALWARSWVPWPVPASKYNASSWQDGVFGKDMDTAVRWAQQHVGVIPDGVIGPQTIRAWSSWKGK